MDTLLHDLRAALRTLVRRPSFTSAVVATLALGIGANTAIFSFVNGVLLRPLPYPAPERLMTLWTMLPQAGKEVASFPDYLDWRAGNATFQQMAGFANSSDNLAPVNGDPERVPSARVTGELFGTLGVRMSLGRALTPSDEVFGSHHVVVLSDALWRRRFGAEQSIVGSSVLLNAVPYIVVGVAPPTLRLPERVQLWTPFAVNPANPPLGRRGDFLHVVGRLKPGVTLERARADMGAVGRRLELAYPGTNDRVGVEVIPLHEDLVGPVKTALLVFAAAVGLVLLIACANVANLLLARATARQREMAVRVALGAGRPRLVRQMLTESVVVALLGGMVGVLLAVWGVQALKAMAPPSLPRLADVRVDGAVLFFSAAISLVTGLAFGLVPALRVSTLALGGALSEGSRGSSGGAGAERVRNSLVLAQVALALVLLTGSGLLVRSFAGLQHVELGFRSEGVVSAQVVLPIAKYKDDARVTGFFRDLVTRTAAIPGVSAVGLTTDVPLSAGYNHDSFGIAGRPAPARSEADPDAVPTTADAGYFGAMGIPLLAGRLFGPEDTPISPRVAVVNQEMVRRHFGGRSPIGERVSFNTSDSTAWLTIVGVVGSTRLESVGHDSYAQVYSAVSQSPQRYLYVIARTALDPAALIPALRREVTALDPAQPIADAQTMNERIASSVAQARLNSVLVGSFSLMALALAALGIYGVVSYAVAQRTREIGIRIALGATTGGVLRLVVRQGMAPALLGIAAGLAGAFAITRLMRGLLFGVSATDPLTFAIVAGTLAVVAFLACLVPARRAAHVDPIEALRSE